MTVCVFFSAVCVLLCVLFCCVYVVVLSQEGTARTVRHYQFTSWPENGKPSKSATTQMIEMLGKIEKSQQQSGNGPIVIHCRWEKKHLYKLIWLNRLILFKHLLVRIFVMLIQG